MSFSTLQGVLWLCVAVQLCVWAGGSILLASILLGEDAGVTALAITSVVIFVAVLIFAGVEGIARQEIRVKGDWE